MRALIMGGLALSLLGLSWGQTAPTTKSVYTCTDAKGRKLTADRPITECLDREQRVLNPDGSVREIVGPSLTPEQRAEAEAQERKRAAQEAVRREELRRDRSLLQRYPDEAAHAAARTNALEQPRRVIRDSQQRIAELSLARKPLLEEAEFYPGKELPLKLKQQIDFNDLATQSYQESMAAQEAEIQRINRRFDDELARLKRLWASGAADAARSGRKSATGETPLKP